MAEQRLGGGTTECLHFDLQVGGGHERKEGGRKRGGNE